MGELWQVALFSLLLGVIFYQLPITKLAGVNDRLGYFHCILSVCLLPNLLININRVVNERRIIQADLDRRLYGRATYYCARVSY